ncbi:MAG TPA: EamA family transporter, partial [Pseudobdellovibrionaceae bacterium]|nr:EamA family transporter [Pseudobdellovibrionaceae bacterium]
VIGFTIQLRTQKVLNSTTASMLFLLESPFSLVFGVLLLKESFGPLQAAGAVLISVAALQTARLESTNSK